MNGDTFPRFVAPELYKRQYPTQTPSEAALDYLAAIFRSHARSHPEQRELAAAVIQDYFDWKARQPKVDTPTSHLRNALQVATLLAAELPKMIGNPGYQDDAKKALEGIDARIRAALDILERGKV